MKKKWLLGILSGLCALTCMVGFSSCGHTHTYTDEVTNPTCTEQGYTTHTCECGERYKDTYVNALGHSFVGEECVACGKTVSKGLAYELSEDGSYYIATGIGTCTDTELIIPSRHEGKTVKEIGEYAFHSCTSLTSVVVPDSVTSIGYGAFQGCTNLTGAIIGNGVTRLSMLMFSDCTSLTSIEIPNSVTGIGRNAFSSCESLTSIDIPDSVTRIGDGVFWMCDSLTSVFIGNGVTSIGDNVFYGCTSLTSIEVDTNNTTYKSMDGNLYSKDGETLIQYAFGKTATSFTIPDSVTSIGSSAFSDCSSLTSIVIPDSVTSIDYHAFSDCSGLTSIVIPDSVTSIGWDVFNNCTSLTIYCEAESQPSGWDSEWNSTNCSVVWGYKAK